MKLLRCEKIHAAASGVLLRAGIVVSLALLAGCDANTPASSSATSETAGESIEKTDDKGPVKITARVTPKAPRLSDTIVFELTLSFDPELEVKPPVFGKGVKEFVIRDYIELPEKLENGRRVRRWRYRLEAEQAGKLLIRSQRVEYMDKRAPSKDFGKRLFAASPPLEVNVSTQLGETQPDLKNLSLMAEPVPLSSRSWAPWIVGALAGGIVGGIAAWYAVRNLARKPAAQIQLSAEEIARRDLAALLAEKFPERREFQTFYVRLTGIVRAYIEGKTGIHAPEQTTEEFLRDPAAGRFFAAERAVRLRQFLEAADMVKYAAQQPGGLEIDESVERARGFIGMNSLPAPLPVVAAASGAQTR